MRKERDMEARKRREREKGEEGEAASLVRFFLMCRQQALPSAHSVTATSLSDKRFRYRKTTTQ